MRREKLSVAIILWLSEKWPQNDWTNTQYPKKKLGQKIRFKDFRAIN